ncbi:MAG: hypothetical protein ACOYMN_24135 [Roseimicrobium sp.]
MPNEQPVPPSPESPAVGTFLGQLQGIINRLAGQSAACKNWTAALASAVIIFALKEQPKFPLWTLSFLVLLLGTVDAYYLSLERSFVDISRDFVKKLHDKTATWRDVFHIPAPPRGFQRLGLIFAAWFSFAVWPFYLGIAAVPVGVHGCVKHVAIQNPPTPPMPAAPATPKP